MYSENFGQHELFVLRLTTEYEQSQRFETANGDKFLLQCTRL